MKYDYRPKAPAPSCIDCDYNTVGKSGWQCGKDGIMITLNKILKAHKPKDMVPMSYELIEKIANKLRGCANE